LVDNGSLVANQWQKITCNLPNPLDGVGTYKTLADIPGLNTMLIEIAGPATYYIGGVSFIGKPTSVPSVQSITITGDTSVLVDGSIQLKATVLPNDAIQSVTWSVNDKTIASIDDFGKITGLKAGTVSVSATTTDTIAGSKGKLGKKAIVVKDIPNTVKDTIIANFEGSLKGWRTWDAGASFAKVANPGKDAVNSSDSVIQFNQANWAGFQDTLFAGSFKSYYVKVQYDVYLTTAATVTMQIDAGSPAPDITKHTVVSTINKWVRITEDVKGFGNLSYKQIWFRLEQAAGMIYIDNVKLLVTPKAGSLWTEASISNVVFGKVDSPKDFTGKFYSKWDKDSVYMKFIIADDSIVNVGTFYDIDNIEIYFDMNNSKRIQWPRNNPWHSPDTTFDAGDHQFRITPGLDTVIDANNLSIVGQKVVYTRTDTGYNFIVNIPWKSIDTAFVPVIGKRFGFDILASDCDDAANVTDANRNQISLNCSNTFIFNDPSLWATIQFEDDGIYSNIPDNQKPTSPANVIATATNKDVKITWDASTDNIVVQNYTIYQGTTVLATILSKKSGNTYTVNGLADGNYSFGVVAVDIYGNVSSKVATTVSVNAVNINENSIGVISMYPNPVTDVLHLSNTSSVTKVEIFNSNGQLELSFRNTNGQMDINTLSLNNGVYILRAYTDKNVYTKQFVK